MAMLNNQMVIDIIIITIYHNWSHLMINSVDEASNQSHCGMTRAQRCTHITYNVHLDVFMLHGIYYPLVI